MKKRHLTRKGQVGQPLVVRVQTPATSGYKWQFTPDETAWRLTSERKHIPVTFGGTTETEFQFEPLRAGKITIHGTLQRPWEDKPVEALDIEVTAE